MSKSKFRSSVLPFSTSKVRLLLAIMNCQFQVHIIPFPVRSCKAFNLVSFLHFRRMGILSSILHCISSSSEAIPPFVLHKTCFTQQRILESNCSIFFFKTTKPKKWTWTSQMWSSTSAFTRIFLYPVKNGFLIRFLSMFRNKMRESMEKEVAVPNCSRLCICEY